MSVKKRKHSIFLRFLVIGVSVYMIWSLAGLWSTYNQKSGELASLNEEYAVKKSDVDDLKELLQSGSAEQIIEKAARQRLGFVYSNEEIYVDISGN